MKKKLMILGLVSLVSLVANDFVSGQETTWKREYSAQVNGQVMDNAYSGGNGMTWPKVAFCDIDADGDFDLFIGGKNGELIFYRNDGTKLISNFVFITNHYGSIKTKANANPAFCDIDADGDLDLFVGSGSEGCIGGNVAFYRNDGNAKDSKWFLVTDSLAGIDVCDQSAPAFCDIDADGDLDLFVGGGYGNITFCRNIGTPKQAVWDTLDTNYKKICIGWKSTPFFADIDNDGDFDLFIGNDGGEIGFYRNDGTPQEPVWAEVTRNYAGVDFGWLDYTAPTFCDIDADGDFDMFVSEHYGSVNFYRNGGDKKNPIWVWETGNYPGGAIDIGSCSAPALVDIDNDGDLDLFIGKANGQVSFYRNNGDKNAPDWCLESENYNGSIPESTLMDMSVPTFCDINADGDFDMFVGNDKGTLYFYRNDGIRSAPIFNLVTHNYVAIPVYSLVAPAFSDIDADGDFDLFLGCSDGTIFQYSNIGKIDSAVWTLAADAYNSIDVGSYSAPFFVDIDNDSDQDLFIGGNGGELFFYRNDGIGSAPKLVSIDNHYGSIVTDAHALPVFVDIDNDGDLDLFVGGEKGGLQFWRNTTGDINPVGTENFSNTAVLTLSSSPNPFSLTTKITYNIPESCRVKLDIFDFTGKKVITLVNEEQSGGGKTLSWMASSFPSGIYFCRLQAGNSVRTEKMIILK